MLGSAEPVARGSRQRHWRRNWVHAANGLPGVREDGMSEKDQDRKRGTTCRLPRPKGTAKALRISPKAKSQRACKWGAWGRLSDDGPGQNNPDRSEGPWGRAVDPLERRYSTESRASTLSEGLLRPPRARRTDANCAARWPCVGGKASSERPALEPYWGKPAVRNLRGDDGDSAVRTHLAERCTCSTSCDAPSSYSTGRRVTFGCEA